MTLGCAKLNNITKIAFCIDIELGLAGGGGDAGGVADQQPGDGGEGQAGGGGGDRGLRGDRAGAAVRCQQTGRPGRCELLLHWN